MQKRSNIAQKLRRIRFFFPFQLLILHVKKNHFLLFFWLLLFGFTTGVLASKFGVPQQFLIPEYRGASGILSFYIVGFALGGFITAFNLYSYIMHGYRFPFIATLSKPFHKLSINNFLLPAIFIVVYCVNSAHYQMEKELIPSGKVIFNLLSFLVGVASFQSLSYFYFLYTNKNAQHFGKGRNRKAQKDESPVDSPFHTPIQWFTRRRRATKWHVETYLSGFSKVSLARESKHYDKHILDRVFSQNHINAARFEIVLILSFLIIGNRRENEFFVIPAAASAMLFFTMLLMLVSALHSWLKGWTFTLFIVIMVTLNFFYSDLKIIKLENRAYGLDYETNKAIYNLHDLRPSANQVKQDIAWGEGILNKWKQKLAAKGIEKPKLVVIDCSGGGSRSAFWTMKSLVKADASANGALFDHCVMMTGASGGMLGAAEFREMLWRSKRGMCSTPYDSIYAEHLASDLLNPIILSMTVNDWFIRYQKLDDGAHTYTKDRGWSFEQQLNKNTHGVLDKRLYEYSAPEAAAEMPMFILSPTIINDGRRLIIASQPVSYLTQSHAIPGAPNPLPEDVEFTRLFKDQGSYNLRFTSALRMNATFPYVLPMATLPSEPPLEIMDAGMRDNFGLKTTLQYLYTFRDWINANTSGVIIVQVRDTPKGVELSDHTETLFGRLSAPLGSIYGNMTKTHEYNNEQMLRYLKASFEDNIELVTFQLNQDKKNTISLSWHLTQSERVFIRKAVNDSYFLSEMNRLNYLLTEAN